VLVAPGCPQPGSELDTTGGTDDTGSSEASPTGSAATNPDEPTSAPEIMGDTDEPGSSTGTGEPLDWLDWLDWLDRHRQ